MFYIVKESPQKSRGLKEVRRELNVYALRYRCEYSASWTTESGKTNKLTTGEEKPNQTKQQHIERNEQRNEAKMNEGKSENVWTMKKKNST